VGEGVVEGRWYTLGWLPRSCIIAASRLNSFTLFLSVISKSCSHLMATKLPRQVPLYTAPNAPAPFIVYCECGEGCGVY